MNRKIEKAGPPDEARELKLCGLAAVRARFQRDAKSINRLYFDYETGRKIGLICKALAAARKIYRCVEPRELEKIAGSIHHGGIVAVVAETALRPATPAEIAQWARRKEPLLVLDRIGNAHNLGAIARTAAFFGVPRLVIPEDPAAARPTEAAYRVAEGGMEHIEIRAAAAVAPFLRDLATAGYEVVGAAAPNAPGEGPNSLQSIKKDLRSGAPIALVLGNEEHGLSPSVAAACTRLVTIPGKDRVDSLNVSAAAAVLIWELFGQG